MPRKMAAGQPTTFALDLAPPEDGGQRGGRLRIQGDVALGDSRWQARLNDRILDATDDVSEPYPTPYPPMLGQPEEMRAWTVPADTLRDGPNRVELTLQSGNSPPLAYLDLALR